MKAYKVFSKNWTCRDFQYEVGKTYIFNGTPKLYHRGFHACTNPADCFDYYSFTPDTKFAEVELTGELDGPEIGCSKIASSTITITREIPWTETLQLVNSGPANTGRKNSGKQNSGDQNSGDRNSGYRNSGDQNSGARNSGNRNSGNRNSGYRNSGYRNSGDQNSGDQNSGDQNSGDQNSGDRNSGDRNSGDRNSGDRNSGNWNSGDRNSGNWNSGDWNSGYFNSRTPDFILVFNKPCNRKTWESSKKPQLLCFTQTRWVSIFDMTKEELKEHPTAEAPQNFLKHISYKEAWRQSWDNAPNDDKQLLYKLPNFDPEIFEEISGIDVTQDPTWPPE